MAEKKGKRYVSDNAQLMAEWNWERNTHIVPDSLTLGSHKIVWWKCKIGHNWQATIKDRTNGKGCPYCSGRYPVKGENDLQTVNPVLAYEWNLDKNNGLTAMDVLPNSNRNVWWKCSNGHEWQASVANRTKGNGCPYCAGKKALKGYNDLQTVNPTLSQEWNYEKNNGLTPTDVTPNSDKKVWWRCNKGHEWQAIIGNRNRGNGCPYCSGLHPIKGETDLLSVNPILAEEWDYEKNIGLRPENFTANSGQKVWWKCKKGHEWQATIHNRNSRRGCPICNSERNTSFPEYVILYYLKKYGQEVIHSYRENGYELDIYIPCKKAAIEYDGGIWHKNRIKKDLEKNKRCQNDGIVLYRIREGLPTLNDSSIDYLVQERQTDLPKILEEVLSIIIGQHIHVDIDRDSIEIENLRDYSEKSYSILVSNPEIANEWDFEKNGNLKPYNLMANSNKKVWWKCNKGHSWQATLTDRNRGRRCPFCMSKKILLGYNDLQTTNPALVKEWYYEKNNNILPTDVFPNSNKKVWWKCVQGHEWQARIADRTRGTDCPQCAREKRKKN